MSALLSSMKTPAAYRLTFSEASHSCHCYYSGGYFFAGKFRTKVGTGLQVV